MPVNIYQQKCEKVNRIRVRKCLETDSFGLGFILLVLITT